MRNFLARLADILLGPRCHHCGTRVFPRDQIAQYAACSKWSR